MRWVGENSMPSLAARPSSPGVSGMPNRVGRGMPPTPFGTAGQALPIDDDETDDLAERQRDDGEIIAAQPQHRKTQHHAPQRREDAGERQADPERQTEIGREQRIGIGADRIKRDIAEVEQSGEADHHVESPTQHHIGQHQNAEIEDVALIVEDHRHQKGEDQKHRRHGAAQQRQHLLRRRRHDPDRADRSPPVPQQFHDNAAAEHDGDHGGEIAEPGPVDQLPGRPCLGANADHQRKQHQRHQGADQGFLEDERDHRGARRPDRFWRERGHAVARQTFSTSGRPSRPVGRKISTTIRIENAATSLYSTEK